MIPLQIFEKHPTADAYRVGGFYSPYALVSTDKRFSDAELAAEYWVADADCWKAEKGGVVLKRGEPTLEKMRTLYRFFSRPNAADSDYE